jgi:putative oxidoreductase
MGLGLLILRVVVGGLLAGHGAQKLFAWFGGHGPEGTAGFFDQIGLQPGRVHARAAGLAEFCGGLAIAFGLFTPFAAAAIIGVMTAAIITVHAKNGVWVTEQGFEYNLVLIAVAFALAAVGPGAVSLDSALGLSLAGAGWALGALAAGLIGGYGAVASGHAYRDQHERSGTPAHPA